jgi:hypothetical protein
MWHLWKNLFPGVSACKALCVNKAWRLAPPEIFSVSYINGHRQMILFLFSFALSIDEFYTVQPDFHQGTNTELIVMVVATVLWIVFTLLALLTGRCFRRQYHHQIHHSRDDNQHDSNPVYQSLLKWRWLFLHSSLLLSTKRHDHFQWFWEHNGAIWQISIVFLVWFFFWLESTEIAPESVESFWMPEGPS